MFHIYTLQNPDTLLIHYVGQSTNPKLRLTNHLNPKIEGNKKLKAWVASLAAEGKRPVMERLDKADTEEEALRKEQYWIDALRALGQPLLNRPSLRECSRKHWRKVVDFLQEHATPEIAKSAEDHAITLVGAF